ITFSVGEPEKGALRLASGSASPGPGTVAGAGIDEAGMLVYVEVASARDAARDGVLIEGLLTALGCKEKLFLAQALGAALGGDRDLAGHAVPTRPNLVNLVRKDAPGAVRIFKDTPIVPVKEWYPLQA